MLVSSSPYKIKKSHSHSNHHNNIIYVKNKIYISYVLSSHNLQVYKFFMIVAIISILIIGLI